MVCSLDDAPGITTRGEPPILVADPRKVGEWKPDRHVLRGDVGKLYTERVAVLVGGLKIATPSECVKFPDDVPTVLGRLGPLHIRERRADVLDPLSGVHIVVGDGDIVIVDDAVGIK